MKYYDIKREEIIMKKLALLLALVLMLSLNACTNSEQQTLASELPESQVQSTETVAPESEKPEGPAYEISYSNAKVWTNSIGTPWVQTIVEITNTGTTNLYLDSGSYDLEDSSGALVASRSYVSTYPSVIAPGEKGIMYEETTLDNYTEDGNLTVIARPSVEEAHVDLVRYNITDVSVSADDFFGVNVLGRVENTTDETATLVYVVAIFYDANNIPIGSAFTILSDELAPGSKIGFEFGGFSLPDDFAAANIANTIVYAYPTQYQF